MPRTLDHDYINELIERLSSIPEDAKPAWGSMTPPQLMGHLAAVVRLSMGRGPELKSVATFMSRNIMRPLVLSGIVPIPKNLPLPKPVNPDEVFGMEEGDIESFHALLMDYLAKVETGDITPPEHAALGNIGIDGWAKLHVAHFEYHCKQFGV